MKLTNKNEKKRFFRKIRRFSLWIRTDTLRNHFFRIQRSKLSVSVQFSRGFHHLGPARSTQIGTPLVNQTYATGERISSSYVRPRIFIEGSFEPSDHGEKIYVCPLLHRSPSLSNSAFVEDYQASNKSIFTFLLNSHFDVRS
jgi:hypothetical protein